MHEWDVVVVLIALVGLAATIAKPIINLTRSITRLDQNMKVREEQFAKQFEHDAGARKRIWEHNNKQDAKIEDHENRITVLETKKHEER